VYRFSRYYRGEAAYVRKGAPPIVMRVLGPAVVLLTLAVLATGIGAIAAGPSNHVIVTAHKAAFILWFGAMTVHVLGHILETPALALADWQRPTRGQARGASARIAVLVLAVALGIGLATLSLGWIGSWRR
jgi:hypothetical protein